MFESRKPLQLLPFALIALVCLGSATAHAGSGWPRETVMTERFDVGSGGTLMIDLPDADLDLSVGSADQIEIKIEVRSRDLEMAKSDFAEMNFKASAAGNSVRLTADGARSKWAWNDNGGMHVVAHITLPERFDLDIRTGDGDVSIEAIDGELKVKSSDGDVAIGRAQTTDAVIESSDGDISIRELNGSTVRIDTSDGDVEVGRIDGMKIEIRSGDGDIAVRSCSGELSVRTGDGDISVGIDLLGETGLHTGDGDISIRVASGAGADVELSGEDVALSGSEGFEGQRSERRIKGSLNGGGPELTATSRDGSVVLQSR